MCGSVCGVGASSISLPCGRTAGLIVDTKLSAYLYRGYCLAKKEAGPHKGHWPDHGHVLSDS